MKRIITLICFLSFGYLFAQDLTINCSGQTIKADAIGGLYVQVNDYWIIKINDQGDTLSSYNENKYGLISDFDVTNPLQITVFYRDMQTVVTLSNDLKPSGTIFLNGFDLYDISAFATTKENDYWLFDQEIQQLKRINQNGETLIESPEFYLLFDKIVTPTQVFDLGNSICLVDSTNGFYFFDAFGNYKNQFLVNSPQSISILDNQLFYIENNIPKIINPARFIGFSTILLPKTSVLAANSKYIYIQNNNQIEGYKTSELRIRK